MSEWKQLIGEWLNEYASLQEHEIKSFAAEHEHNHEIATTIFNLFYSGDESDVSSNKGEDETEFEQTLESVCTQLFSFYRSKEVHLQRFTLQFVPTLAYSYLSSVAQTNKKTYRCIETLLIGLYNFEVVDESGKPKVVSFRLPSLAQSSIYHEPLSLGPQFLTESALRRWEECNTKLVTWGPMSQVDKINAQNRLKVIAALFFIYNRQLSLLPKLALRHFCIAASRIVTQGFQKKTGGKSIARIPVSPNLLLEMVEGAYFSMFNEFYTLALQAVKDIDQRAQYELYPDVMLVTSAVINSLKDNPSGQPCDGPMGISVALSPATTTVTMSKSMITNASFRTKKLPDDIPIQVGQVVPAESADMLTSITEEGEADAAPMQRGGNVRNSKPKLSSFPSVLGKKSKDAKDKAGISNEKKVTLKESSKAIWSSLSSGGGDMVDAQQKASALDSSSDANGSMKDEKMSMSSLLNSTENSDTRSQLTTDSIDVETTPRFAAMQVSSV